MSKTINRLNDNKELLTRFPLNRFVRISDAPILAKGINPNTFLFFTRPPLLTQPIRTEPTQTLIFEGGVGGLWGLNSGPDFLCGYMVKFPSNKRIQHAPTYVSTVKQSKECHCLPVTHVLNIESASVYRIGVDYAVASINHDLVNHLN